MIGRVPVVTAPAEIDIATSGQLWAVLCQWRSRGHATVVMDLTGTVYCDMAGLHELVSAHNQAVADGGGLGLAIRADGAVARLLALSGLEDAIPHFATVERALAQLPPAAIWPLRQDRRAAWHRAHLSEPAVEAGTIRPELDEPG
jgi:anti-anti-sigma factor